MKFAVVIPTKNRDEFLKEALRSVLNQKLKPTHIILIDNAGSKITKKVFKSFFKKKNHLYKQIVKIKNVATLRNLGSKMVNVNYLAFLDDDDYWHKNYLNQAKKILIQKKYDMIITNVKRVDGKKKSKFTYFDNKTFFKIKDFLNKNPGSLCSNLIVKKKTFISLGGFDKNVGGSSDKDLVMKFIIKKKSILYNKKYHVFYRMHLSQWSRFPTKVIKQRIMFYKKYFKFFSFYDHLKFFIIILNIFIKIFFKKF